MNVEHTVGIRIKADGSGLVGETRNAAREFDKLDDAVNRTGKGASDAGRNVDSFGKSVEGSGMQASTATRHVRGFGAALVALPLVAIARGLIDVNLEYDRLQGQLKTITGSQEAANREFAWIQRFASTTPFQLTEVVEAFVKLRARGLDATEPSLRSLGNTAAAMGRSLDQVIEAVADAATGQMERLREFGIIARKEGDEFVFSFQGVETRVKNSSAAIVGYLTDIGKEKFGTAMSDQASKLTGAASNMQDSIKNLAAAFGEAGFNDLVMGATKNITRFADGMARAVKEGDNFLAAFGKGGSAVLFGSNDADERQKLETRVAGLDRQIAQLERMGVRSDGLFNLRQQRAELTARIRGFDTVIGSQTPAGAGEGAAGGGESGPSEQTLKAGQQLLDQLERQKALYGDTTIAAEVRYELEHGKLKDLDGPQKARALALAGELDAMEAATEAEKTLATERERAAKEAERQEKQRAQEAAAKRQRLQQQIEAVRQGTLSEVEAEQERHDRSLQLLEDAERQGLAVIGDYRELRTRLEEQHQGNLQKIRDQANAEERRRLEREAERQAEIWQQPWKNALTGIQNSFVSFYERLFRGGVDSFKSLASAVKDIFIRLAAEVAALMTFQPIVGNLLGGLGLSGVGASLFPAAGGLAGGGGSGVGFGTSLLSGVGSFFSGGFQSQTLGRLGLGIGQTLGFSPYTSALFESAGLNSPYGLVGSLGAQLFGLGGGVGGGIGGTAGSLIGGAFGGPIGAAAGGFLGSVFGGLFGGSPPRQTGGATIDARTGSVLSSGAKASTPDQAIAIAQQVQQRLAQAFEAMGIANNAANVAVRTVTNAAKKGESPFTLFRGGYGNPSPFENFSSADALVQQGSLQFLRDANLSGDFRAALDRSKTIDEFIQLAQQVRATTEAEKAREQATLDQTAQQRRQFETQLAIMAETNEHRAAVMALTQQFDQLAEQARALGADPALLERARTVAFDRLARDQRGQLRSLLEQGRGVLGIPTLEAFQRDLSFGAFSQVSTAEQLRRAQAEFGNVSRAALAGDAGALGRFVPLAQQVLELNRSTNASGPAAQAIVGEVNTAVNTLLERQRALEASLIGDLSIKLEETTQDQIAAIREQTRAIVDSLSAIDERLRRVA